MRAALALASVGFALAGIHPAVAQTYPTYPTKIVRVVVPGPSAGLADILARTIAEKLTETWGKQVIVDNRAGASGQIGTRLVAQATADGYTLLIGNAGTHAISMHMFSNLQYNPVRDFAPITLVATAPNILVVHPSLPARSVKELIALAKARPGKLTFASPGVGIGPHLSGELFSTMAGVRMLHVPYRGLPLALVDLIAGNVSLMFPNIVVPLPYVKSGRLRALGVTSLKRLAVAPDIPTIAEAGLPGFESIAWYGLFAPAGTLPEIISKLSADVTSVIKMADVREFIDRQGADPVANTPDEFAAFQKNEIHKWGKVIKEAGIKAD